MESIDQIIRTISLQVPVLQQEFFGNTLLDYSIAVVVFVLTFAVLLIIKRQLINRLHKLTENTDTDIDDLAAQILSGVGRPFYFLLAFGLGIQFINQPEILQTFGKYLAWAVLVYSGIRAIQKVVQYLFDRAIRKRLVEDPRFDPSAVKILSKASAGVIWVIGILLVVQNLGYDITALVAGLGIGGIAIAFALQSVLSDVFASISIYFDRPFATGDFIVVGEDMGTVKHIGLKSTRIQSLWGEEIVLPNKNLTEARIHNYKKVANRRSVFTFAVTYDTPVVKLRKISEIIKEIMHDTELANLDRAHWKEFGDSGLIFEVMYYADTTDYNVYMDVRQEVNLKLKERLEKEGVEFAYPTQTVFVRTIK